MTENNNNMKNDNKHKIESQLKENKLEIEKRLELICDNKESDILDKKISIAWIDLTFKISKNWFRNEKIILDSINGFFEFGALNALMGPSGAGKTTLLKCIIGRNKSKLTDETKIFLSSYTRIRTCFISQDVTEHLLNGLKAKEALSIRQS